MPPAPLISSSAMPIAFFQVRPYSALSPVNGPDTPIRAGSSVLATAGAAVAGAAAATVGFGAAAGAAAAAVGFAASVGLGAAAGVDWQAARVSTADADNAVVMKRRRVIMRVVHLLGQT